MLRDVFYYGNKPNVHPREKFAKDLKDARKKATTPDFWIINEFCDYTNFDWDFDFEFLPDEDVWAQDHNNVWPSVYQKDSGTWLCSKNDSDIIIYRNDVNPLKRKNIRTDIWTLFDLVDESKFDFGWHPDPTDPPYIYRWGNKYYPVELMPAIEYKVPGATEVKYMLTTVELLPDWNRYTIIEDIEMDSFDFGWRPDPREPAFIYVFGNKQYDGTIMPTVEYHCKDATERKYISFFKPKLKQKKELFEFLEDCEDFDFSWRPNPTSPPYIYAWGNQWNKPEDKISIQYVVEGATEYQFMDERVKRKPSLNNWIIPKDVDVSNFDFSWEPSPADNPYIYQFGTQWQKDGGPRYVIPGATEVKYIDVQTAKALPTVDNWVIPEHIDVTDFDFSWHPDSVSPKYIYQFGTQWALTGGPKYVMEGATEVKYMDNPVAKALPNRENWVVPADVDASTFDFSWHPYLEDKPYVYVFGTQHQKTGGPKYMTPGVDGTSAVKYIDRRILQATRLPNKKRFAILNNYKIESFDWSWHPDDTVEPYIYVFGNTQYPGEIMPTIEYGMPGAKQVKYVDEIVAKLAPDLKHWHIPEHLDCENFDFSWKPNPTEPPYIYQFGTQWQKTGGPQYIVPSATEIKYVDIQKAVSVSYVRDNWIVPDNIDITSFDFSWHPDDSEQPYIYEFGTQHQNNGGPKYIVEGATETKYVDSLKATAIPTFDHWEIPEDLDTSEFDFSWHPDNTSPAFIYEFGTQWQKTGGPRYIVEGAIETYYESSMKATYKPKEKSKYWHVPKNLDISEFDFSWHPDSTEKPYIYQFGTQWALTGGPRYIVPEAEEIKYVENPVAKMRASKDNWIIPDNIDVDSFDFSWHPYVEDQPYIYVFGTQWQKTGGPKYITPGATESSPVKYIDRRILKATRLPDKSKFTINRPIDETSFDFSWHPDETDVPYIYQIGTQWQETGGPIYIVKDATEYKYVTEIKAKVLSNKENYIIPDNVDVDSFDFSWHPDDRSPPYIYEFATVWNDRGGPKYKVEGATDYKYVDVVKAKLLPNKSNWEIPDNIDDTGFNYSWVPHPDDPPLVYQFGTQWQKTGGPKYVVKDAKDVKYIDVQKVRAKPNPNDSRWEIPAGLNIDDVEFFSWHPDSTEKPYIYQFGTHWALTGGPKFVMPHATETKFIDDPLVKTARDMTHWIVPNDIDTDAFDFTWHPYGDDQPYVYQFGTQHQKTGGPKYITPGTTIDGPVKYVDRRILKAKKLSNKENFKIEPGILLESFDWSWHPDDTEDPYNYVFGNDQYSAEKMPTIRYEMKGATQTKYVNEVKAKLNVNYSNWIIPDNVDTESFDFSWVPDPNSPPYIYEFATVWNNRGGPKYVVENATEYNYIENIKAKLKPSTNNWIIPDNINVSNFDFSWVPHPEAPPYIYQFGTLADDNDGPRYVHPDNTGEVVRLLRVSLISDEINQEVSKYYIETNLEELIQTHIDEIFWALNKDVDYSNFDFDWRPSIEQARYIHAFGTKDNINTQTYFVSGKMYQQGYKDINYVQLESEIKVAIDMFFVDRGNTESQERFRKLKEKFPNIQKTRFLNTWVDTINRCINRANTQLCWIINSELDYSIFDFAYYPNPWQMKMVHVFGTQWSHWGTTFMVNRETFAEDTKYIKIIEHLSNLNFVKDRRAIATNNLYDIILINHGNKDIEKTLKQIEYKACGTSVKVVDYAESYLTTLKNIVKDIYPKKEHYLWICSSICDYANFDFSYISDPFAKDNLHVFPSGKQKFGDTFLIDVNKTKELIDDLTKLEDYTKVNYNQSQRLSRLPAPVINIKDDTHVSITDYDFDFPYAIFQTEEIVASDVEPMSLWTEETKTITITSTGASRIIAPKEVRNYVEKELYDYPYIKTASKLIDSKPLDIVFLSNGEKCSEDNYEHLLAVTKGLKNRVVRVDGVNGRVEAYHAALNASETPWAFTVFAKLKVNNKFDWNWQPDRLQIPKHYIFHAKNTVNGLVYGHQGMIAYNKKLTLANNGKGLDFTLDDPHETVKLLSGTATFNTDAYSTWRTAFREVIKLKSDYTDISQERLQIWLTIGKGKFSEYCLSGANDAVEYYDIVQGDIDQLKNSYEWDWLKKYYNKKYK